MAHSTGPAFVKPQSWVNETGVGAGSTTESPRCVPMLHPITWAFTHRGPEKTALIPDTATVTISSPARTLGIPRSVFAPALMASLAIVGIVVGVVGLLSGDDTLVHVAMPPTQQGGGSVLVPASLLTVLFAVVAFVLVAHHYTTPTPKQDGNSSGGG
eukprot:5055794-Prymnesium_polylepis.1